VYNRYTMVGMMRHAGQEVKNKRKLARIISRVDSTTKGKLIDIMRTLEQDLSRKSAAQAYDMVTRAINAWLYAYSIDLPKGLHAKLLLANCFSINLCWKRGRTGHYPDYPYMWIGINDRLGKPGPRAFLWRLRLREWSRFKSGDPSSVTTPLAR
jgi:hypothetical protein